MQMYLMQVIHELHFYVGEKVSIAINVHAHLLKKSSAHVLSSIHT